MQYRNLRIIHASKIYPQILMVSKNWFQRWLSHSRFTNGMQRFVTIGVDSFSFVFSYSSSLQRRAAWWSML